MTNVDGFLPLSASKSHQPGGEVLIAQNNQKIPFHVMVNFLEAYEDKVPPPGASKNHPVGNTVVRLRIENLTEKPVNFDIKKIDIVEIKPDKQRQTPQRRVVLTQATKQLSLGGRQIIEQGFRLTNRQGFGGAKKLKAVVTYKFSGKTYITESAVIEVR
ncbi:MAG: hypothetical protein VKL59_16145 [Nostocaceae cyanobacterium]|nr:hypothetical protein [Nostocaceae cyanobacterium]